ncbi:MAG: hypothetical protein LBT10_01920, partial [Methanobrevibacter sp.]|nr:hypothetical protein [Methanobrevibacter sp.]
NDTNYEVTYNPNTIKWNRLNSKEGTLNNLHIQEMTKTPIGQVKETAKSLMSRVRTEVNQITPTLTIEEAELKTSNYKVNLKLDENTIVKVNDTNKDGKIEIRTNINLQYPDGTSHQIGEQTNFTRNTILWDLGNVSSVTISNNFAGFVLANNATIKVDGSFDGSLLGKCLNITSEIHRWDYQPKTPTPPTPVEPPVVPPVTPPVEPETPPETPVPTPPGEVTPPEEPTTPEPITPELPVIPEPEEPIVPTPEEPIPDIPTPEKPEIEVPEVEEPKEVEEPELKQEEEITNVQKDVEQGQESKEVKELPALGEYESIANALIALGIIFVGLALFETVRTIRRRK